MNSVSVTASCTWGDLEDAEGPVTKEVAMVVNIQLSLYCGYFLRNKTFVLKLLEKPAVMQLPEKSILPVGDLVLLTCEVTGDPEPSVTWTKNGKSSIPRAQFENDGRILVIKYVRPDDSGVYECKASNKFGESRTSTTVIVAGKVH